MNDIKLKFAYWVHKNLSGDKEEETVPGDWMEFQFGDIDHDPGPHQGEPMFTAVFQEGGHSLWIAYTGGKWLFHCWSKDAINLARFILWDYWAKATWFGLKRKIWHWSNSEIVKSYGRVKP